MASAAMLANSAVSAPASWPIFSPVLAKELRKEYGKTRGTYFIPNALVSDQIGMGLGLPDETRQLADGNFLVSGCMPHSCTEEGAVIVTPSGNVLASGLINYPCVFKRKLEGVHCDARTDPPVLTVFAKAANNKPAIVRELADWAHGERLRLIKGDPQAKYEDIALTEIKVVPE